MYLYIRMGEYIMKKFIIFSLIALVITTLHANGACLLQDIQKKNSCSGGAAPINNSYQKEIEIIEQKQQLEKTYQIPTMSYPVPVKNGFPLLNQNCMIYGNCFPK